MRYREAILAHQETLITGAVPSRSLAPPAG